MAFDQEAQQLVSSYILPTLKPGSDLQPQEQMTALRDRVDEICADLDAESAKQFRERVEHFISVYLKMGEDLYAEQGRRDVARPVTRVPARSSGYVGRTVVRAVIWNTVNSIFRAFR